MKALIVGLGFGKVLYGNIYKILEWEVTTVDLHNSAADYRSITDIPPGVEFDIAHICTPNHTHYQLAAEAAPISKIVMVEKPGVRSSSEWQQLLDQFPHTRFMMTKNNQYRFDLADLQSGAADADVIDIVWSNRNRIPNPGSWFTNKELAFGGVSRDLMPHLLSIYQMLNANWRTDPVVFSQTRQNWNLDNIVNSDYGTVSADGVYNVDDYCVIQFGGYTLTADWASKTPDKIGVYSGDKSIYQLGLCPESAYRRMILTATAYADYDLFWEQQKEMDLWIHQQLETL